MAKQEKKTKQKVKFVKSPTGLFKLGYVVGETAVFEGKQAAELIEMGYAEPVK